MCSSDLSETRRKNAPGPCSSVGRCVRLLTLRSQVRTLSGAEYNSQYSMDDSILGIMWVGQLVLQVVNTVQLAMLIERK